MSIHAKAHSVCTPTARVPDRGCRSDTNLEYSSLLKRGSCHASLGLLANRSCSSLPKCTMHMHMVLVTVA